jgi:hypothetical protein
VCPQGHARTIEQFAQGLARIARLIALCSADWRRLVFVAAFLLAGALSGRRIAVTAK